jgi:membrane protease YdiL (CAAX protease family)
MLSNSSKVPEVAVPEVSAEPVALAVPMYRRVFFSIGLPVWVFLGFMLAQALVLAVLSALKAAGVSFASFDPTIFNAVGGAVIYGFAILLVLGAPWLVKKRKTTREELGLQRLPSWKDILLTPAGMVVYLILTTLVTMLATAFLTFVDYNQAQETGFKTIASQPEYILAFISLVIVAPVAEEILFRGYLLGKLRKYAPLWLSILITSALFGFVHFQWNVGIDVFVLSIVLCLLRVVSGSLWPSILLHMLKNGVAFYFLFINPALLSTLGG